VAASFGDFFVNRPLQRNAWKTEMIQSIFCEARIWKPHLPRNAT
jgi:hypothetical protein